MFIAKTKIPNPFSFSEQCVKYFYVYFFTDRRYMYWSGPLDSVEIWIGRCVVYSFFLYDMTSSVHLFALIYVLNINTNYTSQIHKPHIKNPKQPPFLKNLFLFLISYGRCSVVFKLSHCAFYLYLVYFEISILYESVKIYDMSWYSFFSWFDSDFDRYWSEYLLMVSILDLLGVFFIRRYGVWTRELGLLIGIGGSMQICNNCFWA